METSLSFNASNTLRQYIFIEISFTGDKHFPEYEAPENLITLCEMQPASNDKDVICTYNEDMNG